MSTNKDIAKNASLIGFWTLFSRVLGFIRDVIIARLFGIQVYAQAFVIAFRIPNLFRDLVAEGAANSALVPVFSEYAVKKSRKEFWELANVILNLLLVIVSAIVLLGIIFSPLIVRLIAPGFLSDPHKFEMTVRLNRFIFPYLLLIALCAYITAILNTLKHFSVSAFAPCLLNISIIICALIFGEGIKGLASGVLLGGVLQLAVQLPMLYKKGFRFRHKALADRSHFFSCFKHPAAPVIGRLMLPRLGSSSIYQLNNFIDSVFGSLAGIVGEGGVAVLYFSYRLIQFPLGIFSNALNQAILPALSVQALEDSQDKLKATLSWGLRTTFLVMLPASVGLISLSRPIVAILFGGGKFGANSIDLTSGALLFYSIGLFAYSGTKILQSGFFSLKDTLTPTKIAGIALIMNIILNSALMFPLKISGLALATSISGVNTFIILFIILSKRLGGFKKADIFYPFIRMLLASLGMGLVCYFISQKTINLSAPILNKAAALGFTVFCSVLAYVIFCFMFKVREVEELRKLFMRRICRT